MGLLRLSEEQWEFVKRFIPEPHMGRPEAILYVLKTGCQWDLLSESYPPKSTVHDRFLLWKKQKVLYRLFRKTRCSNPSETVVHIDSTLRLIKRGLAAQHGGKV